MEQKEKINPFQEYQTDVLFLLVGSNPLPNYVAARLLAKETVVLIHSKSTTQVAQRLAHQLRQDVSNLNISFYTVPESDGPAIAKEVGTVVRALPSTKTVGLNYTGGTKPMAIYSYRSLFQIFPRAVFSYLDARTLTMVIDSGSGLVQRIPVGQQIRMAVAKIADLHGYTITEARRIPRCKEISAAIADVHLNKDGLQQWRDWLYTWSTSASLPDLARFPALESVINVFNSVCGGQATEDGVANKLGFSSLKQCGKYFWGGWLEDYVLNAVELAHQQLLLDDYGSEVNLTAMGRPSFELDVVLTTGYQLFAISCQVTDKKGPAKEHLLEIFVRAKQLGGDEARFAAVTFCDDKGVTELQKEVTEAWDAAGKIRVFGRRHIPDLKDHLLQWLREANQETL